MSVFVLHNCFIQFVGRIDNMLSSQIFDFRCKILKAFAIATQNEVTRATAEYIEQLFSIFNYIYMSI